MINKTVSLEPGETIEINCLICMAKYGEAKNNLVIKTNVTGIDIIPIIGKSGIGQMTIKSVKNLSPFIFYPKL